MSLILFEKKHNVALLTLNDPERLNAMSVAMGKEFKKALALIKKDKDIRVVVLTGAGRAFSSGGNLDMLEEKIGKSKATNAKDLKAFYQMYLEIRNLPQPVIAAVNGSAVGAGFCLMLACDLRLAASSAKMGANFARIGLAPGMGGTYLVTRLAGAVNASEILLTGNLFDADKALQYGLLNSVCTPENLMQKTFERANEIAANGPIAVQIIKKGIQEAQNKTLSQMFDYDSKAQASCFATADLKEGIAAVRAKRSPQFVGK